MKEKAKKSGHKIALAVLVSIILTTLVVSITNVGLSIFLESPSYDDFCDFKTRMEPIQTESECVSIGGEWTSYNKRAVPEAQTEEIPQGYCDPDPTCNDEYDDARAKYDQIKYYVFAVVGFALILLGLFSAMHTIQYTGLASGGILILQGIVTNFDNKITVFISLLLILIILGFLVYKKIEKSSD